MSDINTSEFVAVYDPRSDGDYDLILVMSRSAIEKMPIMLMSLGNLAKLVPSDECDFPSVWSDKPLNV